MLSFCMVAYWHALGKPGFHAGFSLENHPMRAASIALLILLSASSTLADKPPGAVPLETYLKEVKAAFDKAAEEKPAKRQKALGKALNELNEKYRKAKTTITISRKVIADSPKSLSVILEADKSPNGDVPVEYPMTNISRKKFMVPLDGKAFEWTGVPRLMPSKAGARAFWTIEMAEFGIQLDKEKFAIVDAKAE